MISLGHCIRNNAATNIFNKDLDSRNYGVGRYGRVFLFDYDAVEKLTDVKIRTNADREPGEEAVPAWFFEDGVIFLPEELEHGMQLRSPYAPLFPRGERRFVGGGVLAGRAAETAARREYRVADVSGQRQALSCPWGYLRPNESLLCVRRIVVGEHFAAAGVAHQTLKSAAGRDG